MNLFESKPKLKMLQKCLKNGQDVLTEHKAQSNSLGRRKTVLNCRYTFENNSVPQLKSQFEVTSDQNLFCSHLCIHISKLQLV